MKESHTPKHSIHRRELLKGAAAAGLGLATGMIGSACSPGQEKRNLIQIENAKKGTRDWLLTNVLTDPQIHPSQLTSGRCPWIEGYCSANSVRAGEKLQIMVSTDPATDYNLEIFRTGYYNGEGARLVKRYDSLKGTPQPEPPIGENFVRECVWEPAVELTIPDDWLSGVYLGKLTAEFSGLQSYVIFIVRDDRPCDLLFQCSDNTWSAYNRWPTDYSIYTRHEGRSNVAVPSGSVSFDRPYALFTHPVNRIKTAVGSGEYQCWEFPLAFWLEQHGYDVSYISNVDTHADPAGLLRTKGFLSVGHDEYWSLEMYDNVLKARDEGVNLAFLSANSVWNTTPMSPNARGVPYRTNLRAGWFMPPEFRRDPDKEGFEILMGPDSAQLMGARSTLPVVGAGDWTCALPDHWLFEGTGMKKGDSVEGLIGWEWHGTPAMDLPGMQIVAEGDTFAGGKKNGWYTSTLYDGPKNNIVFNAATIWWANGLSSPPGHANPIRHGITQQGVDPRVQRITHNLLQRFIN